MAFGVTLAELRLKTGKSRYRLAESTGIDQTYIQRLENGKKNHPSRDLVLMLTLALMEKSPTVTIDDVDVLLAAAGYDPLRRC